MLKSNGVPQNVQQQGNNHAPIRRPQNVQTTNMMQGSTSLNEFKYGFPSGGLPSLSNKWWGSISPDGTDADEDNRRHSKEVTDDGSVSVMDQGKSECMKEDLQADLKGTRLLTAVRKKRMEEGQKALKLGSFRGHGVNKLSKRERSLLINIFRSSIPNEWINSFSS